MCRLLYGCHVSVYLFSKKLDNLPDCLDNWCTMYGFKCDAREWARRDRNDALVS
jgi:hypothetical protein